ncbi:MAG TPA: hypothetical protein PLU30_18195 [Verrucomicrobiae bacterium]|nr:hypothetical protein [Verrucomicrobiae bacterium]
MVKRLLNWIVGLLRPKISGALGEIRLEVTDAEGKIHSHRFVPGRGKKREPTIRDFCALEKAEE